jgi:Txe/YoeB family toxin of Txe-Axe toxin-antitoxin module
MQLSEYSKNRLKATFAKWEVDRDYSEPMFSYLVYGFDPGSFFTAVLANDFMAAVSHSHSANTIPALKRLVGWINDCMPVDAYGSYTAVTEWYRMDDEDRRYCLERHRLIYTSKEEVVKILKDEPVQHYSWVEDI